MAPSALRLPRLVGQTCSRTLSARERTRRQAAVSAKSKKAGTSKEGGQGDEEPFEVLELEDEAANDPELWQHVEPAFDESPGDEELGRLAAREQELGQGDDGDDNGSFEDGSGSQMRSGRPEAPLDVQPKDYTVSSLLDKTRRNKINLKPAFQREFVWKQSTASKLIESMLMRIPVPTLYFNEVKRGNMDVVDGKQRITSIDSFLKGEFPDGTEFRLTGLEIRTELNGKRVEELEEEEQEALKDYALSVKVISRNSDPWYVWYVYERLNMGATCLNEQELRNAVYQGAYSLLIAELAGDSKFRAMFKDDEPWRRQEDRQLVLRFFAMQRTGPSGFYVPLKHFLNDEMREDRDFERTSSELRQGKRGKRLSKKQALSEAPKEKRTAFNHAVSLIDAIFGPARAFRPVVPGASSLPTSEERFDIKEPIKEQLFDTLMFTFSRLQYDEAVDRRNDILESFVHLCDTPSFRADLKSQPKSVRRRSDALHYTLAHELGLSLPDDLVPSEFPYSHS